MSLQQSPVRPAACSIALGYHHDDLRDLRARTVVTAFTGLVAA